MLEEIGQGDGGEILSKLGRSGGCEQPFTNNVSIHEKMIMLLQCCLKVAGADLLLYDTFILGIKTFTNILSVVGYD